MRLCGARSVVTAALALPLACAFSFSDGPASQCDDLSVQWEGGTGPFQLVLIPIFGTPRNISIPSTAFNSGKGTFTTQMMFPKGQQYLVSMSDASGFGTGGFTPIKTVGDSQGGTCNTTDPGVDFSFELNIALQQCRPFTFSGYSGAVQPVTIMAIVPGGQGIVLHPPVGPQFIWPASVASGTQMVFIMVDSTGRRGGSSDVRTVGITDDSTCLNANSPSSTAGPSATSSIPNPVISSSSSPSPNPTTSSGGFSVAAIVGIVVGALVFLAVVITLGLFCLQRSRFGSKKTGPLPPPRAHSSVNLVDGDPNFQPYVGEAVHHLPGPSPFLATYQPIPQNNSIPPSPYSSQSALPQGGYSQATQPAYGQSAAITYSQPQMYGLSSSYRGDPITPSGSSSYGHRQTASTDTSPSGAFPANRTSTGTTLTAAQRKAAMAGDTSYNSAPRFILHTDVEDALPPPNEDGVVELPPLYSERRAPLVTPTAEA